MNVGISSVSYTNGLKIVRGVQGKYTFSITISHTGGSYNIVQLNNRDSNFRFGYFYSESTPDAIDIVDIINNNNYTNLTVNQSVAQSNLLINSNKPVSLTVTYGMKDEECEKSDQLCFLVLEDIHATYTESDVIDNVWCYNLELDKQCTPGKVLVFI